MFVFIDFWIIAAKSAENKLCTQIKKLMTQPHLAHQ